MEITKVLILGISVNIRFCSSNFSSPYLLNIMLKLITTQGQMLRFFKAHHKKYSHVICTLQKLLVAVIIPSLHTGCEVIPL